MLRLVRWVSVYVAVEEGDLVVFLVFDCELDTRMNGVETSEVVLDYCHAFWSADAEFGEDVIYVFFKE